MGQPGTARLNPGLQCLAGCSPSCSLPKSPEAPWRCGGSHDCCVLEIGSEVEAPKMGLNSSVGKGRTVLLVQETACVSRISKRQAEQEESVGKAVGNGVPET